MGTLTTGDGRRACDMGPLITREHRDKVATYIDLADEDGATVVVDGRGVEVDGEAGERTELVVSAYGIAQMDLRGGR